MAIITGTAADDNLVGPHEPNEFYGLDGDDTIIGGLVSNIFHGGNGNDTMTGTRGRDLFYGDAGDDIIDGGDPYWGAGTVRRADTLSYENVAGPVTVDLRVKTAQDTIGAGVDTISRINMLIGTDFNDTLIGKDVFVIDGSTINGGLGDDIIYGILNGGLGGNELYGGEGNDTIYADEPTNSSVPTNLSLGRGSSLYGENGDDILVGSQGGDRFYGGAGNDVAVIHINTTDITHFHNTKSGMISIRSSEDADLLEDIETIRLLDGDFTVDEMFDLRAEDFSITKNNTTIKVKPTIYKGPVAYLDYELVGSDEGEDITGGSSNDFINLGDGDDASDGGSGDDVLDGGTGSNFLTGGDGSDTFFLDGRSGQPTWSTVTDFNKNDNFLYDKDSINIWGWSEGVSKLLLTQESNGAAGFTGATFHYDLNNDGNIDTSITLTGASISDVPTATSGIVEDNGYILIG